MGENFNIEIREDCKVCGVVLPSKRHRTFCSPKCRIYDTNRRPHLIKYRNEYQNRRLHEKLEASGLKLVECAICGLRFRQVGTHIRQKHNMTAREYRELYGFDLIKGQLSPDLYIIKREKALINKMDKQLMKAGKPSRFKKGQKGLGVYKRSQQTQDRLKKSKK